MALTIDKRHEPKTEYLGEKTGTAEDDFKKGVLPILVAHADVQRAYLAMISNDGRKSWSVALCLASRRDDEGLVRNIGEFFRSMFGRDQFLDMMFLREEPERDLRKVCQAFYERAEPNKSPQPIRACGPLG